MDQRTMSAFTSKETHKFIVVDFDFTTIQNNGIVLISGAISNSLDRFKILKLEGRPLLLPVDQEVRPMRDQELLQAMKEIKCMFSNEAEMRDTCLSQLQKGMKSNLNNLNREFIENYILKSDKINILVVWNGHSNKMVLKRFGIKRFPILNIKCYDKNFNQNFTVQLEKLQTKQIIFEIEIGTFNKSGRLLRLEELHGIICSSDHNMKRDQDPRTNVKYTKCIFDFVLRKCGYENLVKHFE